MNSRNWWLCAVAAVLTESGVPAQDSLPEHTEKITWAQADTPSYDEVLGSDKLFGLIAPTDHAFDDFISPMSNPVYFEDPRTLTEARLIFMNHHLPNELGGDDVQLYAAQVRAALTDKLSLVAAKDGYIVSHSPILNDGFADVSLGLKYNLYKDSGAQQVVSAGASYALPIGSTQALQGRTDGEFHLYLTGGTQVLDQFHFLSATGFRLPSDSPSGNQVWYWSNHFDWQVMQSAFYLFTEVNWFHYMSGGDDFPVPVGGLDLMNLGANGIGGRDVVSGAWGLKVKPSRNTEVGVAYEIPYTDYKDIMGNRLTVDFIFRF